PLSVADLLVEIENPLELTSAEKKAIIELSQKTNMFIYQFKRPVAAPLTKIQLKKLGEQLGLYRLDSNLCADDDGISSLKVISTGQQHTYIPYSNRRISWHTDGYYNAEDRQIRGMLLHCVNSAASGGANALLDPEIAYIHLREHNPDYIYALMHPQAMTIPANLVQAELVRDAQSGPVFSVAGDGHLHMRYSARIRSIEWLDNEITRAARDCLTAFLDSNSEYIFHHRLEPAQGLLCNNVLHNRSAFEDKGEPRLLYRARYFDRIRAA
ncbi:MAG: TauD/TfdA family dioxygenase, partial [Gammaproteobacteria bacterium]|nr:TauD/TfdA family dioxygenase [Gammaproteobacteria bacterium]